MDLSKISTEQRNKNTLNIDQVTTNDLVLMINKEDSNVIKAVELEAKNIAKIIDQGHKSILNGGRIIYLGAGTSGRLGILDASEILPTYGEKDLFIGLIAGGKKAIENPVENAEDNKDFAIEDLKSINFSAKDFVIGIAASGRTPYVISALEYAKQIGAQTASIATLKNAQISQIANISVEAVVGPEVITGSTRMKSGTAQKLILNTISTGIMVKNNKVYSNLMVDIKATNKKLIERAIRMIISITNVEYEIAQKYFFEAKKNVKLAIVMIEKNVSFEEAHSLLKQYHGKLKKIIE